MTVVEVMVDEIVLMGVVVVVVSSLQPHHPGVLQVEVLVGVAAVLDVDSVVVGVDPLLS